MKDICLKDINKHTKMDCKTSFKTYIFFIILWMQYAMHIGHNLEEMNNWEIISNLNFQFKISDLRYEIMKLWKINGKFPK